MAAQGFPRPSSFGCRAGPFPPGPAGQNRPAEQGRLLQRSRHRLREKQAQPSPNPGLGIKRQHHLPVGPCGREPSRFHDSKRGPQRGRHQRAQPAAQAGRHGYHHSCAPPGSVVRHSPRRTPPFSTSSADPPRQASLGHGRPSDVSSPFSPKRVASTVCSKLQIRNHRGYVLFSARSENSSRLARRRCADCAPR